MFVISRFHCKFQFINKGSFGKETSSSESKGVANLYNLYVRFVDKRIVRINLIRLGNLENNVKKNTNVP